jgi:hypothetical protein
MTMFQICIFLGTIIKCKEYINSGRQNNIKKMLEKLVIRKGSKWHLFRTPNSDSLLYYR